MSETVIRNVVTSCIECEFEEGLDVLVCNHPDNAGKPYGNITIDASEREGIPRTCPLRKGNLIIKYALDLS